jgi:dienelactone hydrolase
MRSIVLLIAFFVQAWTTVWAADVPSAPPALPAFPSLPAPTPLTEATAGDIVFETLTPYDLDILIGRAASLPRHGGMGRLFLPAGASAQRPTPAVVVVHGSGGIAPGREMEYGALLAADGYAALVIDYYRPRGITEATPYAAKVLGVTEFDATADAYAALRALNKHPAIDPKRIAVVGFSYGGMATRIAMDARVRAALAPDLPPFAAHVDFYGPCFQDFRLERTTGAPLLTLRGAEDASNDLVACAVRERELRRAGSEVSSVIYARAGHAWQNLAPRAVNSSSYLAGCTLEYDAAGFPSVHGRPLIPADAPPDRTRRFLLRMGSGDIIGPACVKLGYIVGRDDATRVQSDLQVLRFLRQTLN